MPKCRNSLLMPKLPKCRNAEIAEIAEMPKCRNAEIISAFRHSFAIANTNILIEFWHIFGMLVHIVTQNYPNFSYELRCAEIQY